MGRLLSEHESEENIKRIIYEREETIICTIHSG